MLVCAAAPLVVLFYIHKLAIAAAQASQKREDALIERNDILVQALARRSGLELPIPSNRSIPLEDSAGWWDRKPPKVDIVVNPTQGA